MLNLNIVDNKWRFFILPAVIIIAAVIVGIISGGFALDIDFAGGTSVEISLNKTLSSAERSEVAKLYKEVTKIEFEPTVQVTGSTSQHIVIKSTEITDEQKDAAVAAIAAKYPEAKEVQYANQKASYGAEMKTRTLLFTLLAVVLMLIYIWIRFELKSGVMAVICLAINVLVMLSVYAITKIPLSTTFIAALLTVVGYSINDTIVIFDRIRETKKYSKNMTNTEVVEKSIWQSMTRTINTSITTLVTLVVLYVMGASSLKNFAFPIIIGVICGSFTSIFIASPWWGAWCDAKRARATKSAKKSK